MTDRDLFGHEIRPTAPAITREEFLARFKAEMIRRAGPTFTFTDGESVASYADATGPTYWDEPDLRADGPEECAQSDMEEWGR